MLTGGISAGRTITKDPEARKRVPRATGRSWLRVKVARSRVVAGSAVVWAMMTVGPQLFSSALCAIVPIERLGDKELEELKGNGPDEGPGRFAN